MTSNQTEADDDMSDEVEEPTDADDSQVEPDAADPIEDAVGDDVEGVDIDGDDIDGDDIEPDDGEVTATDDEGDEGEVTATDDEGDEGEVTATDDEGDEGEVTATDDEGDEGDGPSRVVLLVGAVVAFVAIAIVGILIATSGDGGGGGGNSAGNDATASDARTDVGIFGTIDQFDRADSTTSLGNFAPGRPWSADAGTWGIRDNEAYVVSSGEFRNHAVIGMGQGDGGAQVRLDKVVNGAGLTFRYVGPYNYWAVVAVPNVATWNVIKVVDGDQEVVGNTGQSPTVDGTTVAVRMRGDTIDVIINGRVRKTIVDDFQSRAGKVGITARGPDSGDARFDDFVAGLPGGIPLNSGGGNRPGGGSTTTTAAAAPVTTSP